MATNATTWFYGEPEKGRPYLIGERLTHTFWANRLADIYLRCTQADGPFKVEGEWRGIRVEMEWEPKKYFKLLTSQEDQGLMAVCAEVLGFRPSMSYVSDRKHVVEWYPNRDEALARLKEIQGQPGYTNVRKSVR
ncbi:MAG: hypothetical protein H6673_07650 [Anaerolineales bacterium]|nr:hypothetical protein [Anaerolineales bacterium]